MIVPFPPLRVPPRVSFAKKKFLGSSIIAQAETVYALGINSWVTIEVNVPPNVQQIYTVENRTLVFEMQTGGGVVSQPVFSDVPIMGIVTIVNQSFLNTTIHSGNTKIRIYSNGTLVILSAS